MARLGKRERQAKREAMQRRKAQKAIRKARISQAGEAIKIRMNCAGWTRVTTPKSRTDWSYNWKTARRIAASNKDKSW